MAVILAVLKDLYTFAVTYRFGLLSIHEEQSVASLPAPNTFDASRTLASQDVRELLQAENKTTENETRVVETPSVDIPELSQGDIGYVFSPIAFLYALPTRTFDGVVATLEYGESFQIKNTQGKWMQILHHDLLAWIHFDDVTTSSAALNPRFVADTWHGPDHESTKKLRTRINDAFHASMFDLPLQNIEYVTYKLLRKDRLIMWPSERPRVAGTWQRLLRGVPGVHMGVAPKTGSVMEYIVEDNIGHVAYVESVFPDGAITLSEIGYRDEGVYSERTVRKDVWRELRPIFIEIA